MIKQLQKHYTYHQRGGQSLHPDQLSMNPSFVYLLVFKIQDFSFFQNHGIKGCSKIHEVVTMEGIELQNCVSEGYHSWNTNFAITWNIQFSTIWAHSQHVSIALIEAASGEMLNYNIEESCQFEDCHLEDFHILNNNHAPPSPQEEVFMNLDRQCTLYASLDLRICFSVLLLVTLCGWGKHEMITYPFEIKALPCKIT